MTNPAPAPRQPSSGFKIVSIVSLILLACSILANLLLFIMVLGAFGLMSLNEGPAGSNVVQETLHKGATTNEKIAILPAHGEVDSTMVERVRKYIDAIHNDPNIKAVIIEVESPGGTIAASDEIHHMVSTLKTEGRVKVIVHMRSLAASGGYYISAPADAIYAEPSALVGSIGVIWPAFEVSGLLQKIGVTPEVITSDPAVFKDAGSPWKKFTDKDREYIKGLVNSAHKGFMDVVSTGRGAKLKAPIAELAIGKIWTAQDAVKYGLVDELAYTDEVWGKAAAAAGLSDPTVVRLKERVSFLDSLGVSSRLPPAKVEIQLSPQSLPNLQSPLMEYRYLPPTVPTTPVGD